MTERLKQFSNALARRSQKVCDRWARHYWHDQPFGRTVRAEAATYRALWQAECQRPYPEIDQVEKEYGAAVDPDWLNNLALHTQIVIKNSPLCYQHGRILYAALRAYAERWQKPMTIFETGTARGFSAVVMAKALADAGVPGKILTFDVLPHFQRMLWNCIDDLEGPKSRAELLSPWQDLCASYLLFIEGDSRLNLPHVAAERIHFAFLDGAHTYRDVLFEFETVAQRQQSGDVIVFDDYNATDFPGLVQAVDAGCETLGYHKKIIGGDAARRYVVAEKKDTK